MTIDCTTLSGRRREICLGVDSAGERIDVADIKRAAYLRSWFPNATPEEIADAVFRRGVDDANVPVRGLGDVIANGIKRVTRGRVKPCGSCKDRAAKLNRVFPTKHQPPVERIEWQEPVRRNFMMHVWPVKDFGAWQWNMDQVLQRAHLFNGRRVIAIAVSDATDSAEVVKEYMRDFTDEFIVVPNDSRLREVVTFVPMLERMETLDANTITFACHAKCVRHRIGIDDDGSTVFDWTRAMYETCLDRMPLVETQLITKAMTGSFKRYGQFTTRGNHRWHYSGTFYWFRNRDVYQRNWRHVDRKFFGTESWPGHMFRPEETGCLFMDGVDDLYVKDYWMKTIKPALEQWEPTHAT